jgi:hypothetical protein
MLDPSPRVRRGAIRASAVARDPADLDAVFEAARVDPEPLVRSDAVRAVPSLFHSRSSRGEPANSAGSDVANRLRDLWTVGDDALREDIAAAWAAPSVFAVGGREALRVLLASGSGPGVLAGAGAVLRSPQTRDPELTASARALLARTVESSSRRNRQHALALAPLADAPADDPLLAAVTRAAKDEDLDVRVAALARLAERGHREDVVKELESFAGQKDHPGSPEGRWEALASRAQLALASIGDVRIQAWIEQGLTSNDPSVRLSALDALAVLGRAARGAPLLADADPAVRTQAACTLLMAARH